MFKELTIMFVALSSATVHSLATGWEVAPEMNTVRSRPAAVVDAVGNIYILGGSIAHGESTNTVEVLEYDACPPAPGYAGNWTSFEPMLIARSGAAAACVDDFIYVIGGIDYSSGSHLALAERYDLHAEVPGWEAIAPLDEARSHAACAVDRAGRIYVIGGYVAGGDPASSVQVYDPARPGSWMDLGHELQQARAHAGAIVDSHGRILVFGGMAPGGPHLDSVERFDPACPEQGWVSMTTIPGPPTTNTDLAVRGADGRAYLVGGWAPGFTDRVERYDPDEDTWWAAPSLPDELAHPGLVLGADGYIYVIGGEVAIHVYTSAVNKMNTIFCPYDGDGTGMIGIENLLELLASWGPCP